MEQSDFMSVSRRGGEILGRLEDDMRQNVERSRPECDRLWTPAMPPQFRWLVLTEDLPAASLGVPATATANPANFDATANSGYGGYTIDTETTLMVIEATGQRRYGEGAWVLCRPQGTVNSGAWEPITRGGRFYATVQTNNATSPLAAYANFNAVETRDGLVFVQATSVPLMAVDGGAAWQQNFPSLPSIVTGTEDSRAGRGVAFFPGDVVALDYDWIGALVIVDMGLHIDAAPGEIKIGPAGWGGFAPGWQACDGSAWPAPNAIMTTPVGTNCVPFGDGSGGAAGSINYMPGGTALNYFGCTWIQRTS